MKRVLLAIAVGTVLSSSALAQSVGEKTGINSALGITPKTEDFIKEAAMSDMLEIEAAKFAQQKGNADEMKFAEAMIADHTKTASELKGMVPPDMKGAIPASLDDASQKKLDKLRDAKPEDFAGEYDSMQVSAHKDAVSLFERYSGGGGGDAKLKDWAGTTLAQAPSRDGSGLGQEPQVITLQFPAARLSGSGHRRCETGHQNKCCSCETLHAALPTIMWASDEL